MSNPERPSRLTPARIRSAPRHSGVVLVCVALLGLACQRGAPGPQVASSAEQVGYAERYPDELERTFVAVSHAHAVGEALAAFKAFPSALSDPNWQLVQDVYEAADEEGRGAAYAQRFEEERTVLRFYEEEKKPLISRVAGGAQHAAKEKGHEDVQFYGAVSFSLERGINQQLEERRRADSNAHALIAEQEAALGKKNVDTLEKQADIIALASHSVHVRMILDEQELARLVDEADEVRSTLEARKEALANAPKPDAAAQARADQAISVLDERVEKAKKALQDTEQRREKLKQDYADAFNALIDDVEKRVDAQVSAAPPS